MPLTNEQNVKLRRAALSVWDTIGYDCLRALEDTGEAKRGRATMKRAHVIEVVVDADNLLEELKRRGHSAKNDVDKKDYDTLVTFMKSTKYEVIVETLKPAFPYSTYGW